MRTYHSAVKYSKSFTRTNQSALALELWLTQAPVAGVGLTQSLPGCESWGRNQSGGGGALAVQGWGCLANCN